MLVLIGSFLVGVILQLVATHFLRRKMSSFRLASNWGVIRESVHRIVVMYLLVHIGLIGGAEVAGEGLANMVIPGLLSVALAIVLFIIALCMLTWLFQIKDRETRISLATHFGSVSVGTFAATQMFLVERSIPFDPSAAAWLALMEVPSILVGATLLGGGFKSLKQTLRDRDVLLLLGSLVVGYVFGPHLVHKLDFLIVTPFEAVLAYFLFDMGRHAGEYMTQLRNNGTKLVIFGVVMPIVGGILGGVAGTLAGMDLGNVILLSTLSASASYVAATAAMGKLVPPRAIAISLTVSLGITLPWNILVGISFYTTIARFLRDINPRSVADVCTVQILPGIVMGLGAVLMLIGAITVVALLWSKRNVIADVLRHAHRPVWGHLVHFPGRDIRRLSGRLHQHLRHVVSTRNKPLRLPTCPTISSTLLSCRTNFATSLSTWSWRLSMIACHEVQGTFHRAFLSGIWSPALALTSETMNCYLPP
jgi:hypothetical protein